MVNENEKTSPETSDINSRSSHHEHSHSHSNHHHHHSHSRSHSSSKSSKKNLKKKIKKFLKNNKYLFNTLVIVAVLAVVISVAAVVVVEIRKNNGVGSENGVNPNSIVSLDISELSSPIPTLSDAASLYLQSDLSSSADALIQPYRNSGRLDVGSPVTLSYSIRMNSSDLFVVSAGAEIWESSVVEKQHKYVRFQGSKNTVDVYNLIPGLKYMYRISVTLSDGSTAAKIGEFETASSPRFLNIDGIVNVRDIGGWDTASGKKIKYGMLYRGSELDGRIEKNYLIQNNGIIEMLGTLGIKRDLDLRAANKETSLFSPLGPSVKRTFYNAPFYEDILTAEGKEVLKSVFTEIANPGNYPIYLHCTYGVDRTGTICCILEALLGVSEENIIKEYELSSLYHKTVTRDNLTVLLQQLKEYEGDSLQKKAENLLLSAGITQSQIQSIRNIFLGE